MVVCDIDGFDACLCKHLKVSGIHTENILVILVGCLVSYGILEIYERHVIVLEHRGSILEAVFHIAVYLLIEGFIA